MSDSQTTNGMNRRQFLRLAASAGAAVTFGPILSACVPVTPTVPAAPSVPTKAPLAANVVIGCWAGYEKFFQTLSFDPYRAKNPGVTINMEVAPASQIYAKLLASKGSKPPIHGTAMNDAFSWTGIADGMWQTLTAKELPNLGKVPEGLLSKAGPFWALNFFGVTYNPKFLPDGIKSWKDLYSPKLAGKVGMWPAYFDAYIMAAKVAGKDEHEIEAGIEAWKAAKANIGLWIQSVAEIHQAIDRGEIWAAPDWGAAAIRDAATGMNLAVTIPAEGAIMNTYYMQTLKGLSDTETQAVNGILDSWLSPELQQQVFTQQYLVPVVTGVTPDTSKLPPNLGFAYTAEDAAKKLYRPDYSYVGNNTKRITDLVAANLR